MEIDLYLGFASNMSLFQFAIGLQSFRTKVAHKKTLHILLLFAATILFSLYDCSDVQPKVQLRHLAAAVSLQKMIKVEAPRPPLIVDSSINSKTASQ